MTFLRIVIPLYLFFEHDLRANASRLSRGKTGVHFSGSCSKRKRPFADQANGQIIARSLQLEASGPGALVVAESADDAALHHHCPLHTLFARDDAGG